MQIVSNDVKYFWGVVEDRMDPLKRGRVRVRVYGEHPYQKTQGAINGIPTSELMWMDVLQPTNSASISGVGSSNTGIVEGTSVYGHFLDKYRMSGIILGTYGASRQDEPNYTEGFSDPTESFPRYLGNDMNVLSQGGTVGKDATANLIQDSNLSIGINPSDASLADIPEDDNPNYTIQQMLKHDEGVYNRVYFVGGYPHIGIGHLIIKQTITDMTVINGILSNQVGRTVTGNPGSITLDEVTTLFNSDLKTVQTGIVGNSVLEPVYSKMNRSRQMALENMAFQMGVDGLAKFTSALGYMALSEWKLAYNALKNSLWFSQTPGRASLVSYCILTGNMEAYGVMPATVATKNLSAAATTDANDDPADPYTPTDTRIMFTEPSSSYNGQYPYVHTYESESGHIQEFDDTPGYERYRLLHPAGVLVEVQPDGTKIDKAKTLYSISNDRNTNIIGNNKVNVKGDEINYVMGSSRRQVDGNDIIYIRGNETKTVEGSGTLYVDGNVNVVIKGQAQITVEQEAQINIQKDATVNCSQNANISVSEKATVNAQDMDITVQDTFNLTATDINLNASGNTTIDSSGTSTLSGGNVVTG